MEGDQRFIRKLLIQKQTGKRGSRTVNLLLFRKENTWPAVQIVIVRFSKEA